MKLEKLGEDNRLFTYKVAWDSGCAPNPYGGICTLAICKPKIRSVAKKGDLIVGFGCKSDSLPDEDWRIVYVMVVDKEPITWSDYIQKCMSEADYRVKRPGSKMDHGDCIWVNTDHDHEPLDSWSGHGRDDFQRDVASSRKVILSTQFWYFGKGDKYRICLDEDLAEIVPVGVGHRSTSNNDFRDDFVKFFNRQIEGIREYGKLGEPSVAPSQHETASCFACCKLEKASDAAEEEIEQAQHRGC